MRVYLPVTRDDLRALRDSGALPGGAAYAVTAEVRAALPDADEEEREFAACLAAAEACHGRPMVAAADAAAEPAPGPDVHPAQVLVGPVPRARVAALLVGEPDADPDDGLRWYAVSELGDLLGG